MIRVHMPPRSRARQKGWKRALRGWESVLRGELADPRRELELAPEEVLPDDLPINEVVELADPDTVRGLDAVIPAPDVDLAREYFQLAAMPVPWRPSSDKTRLVKP